MSENKDAFEFLSKCWVPFVASEHRVYYACGNTRIHDFLRDFKVSREMDVLVLGLGDVRHVMKTVAGLSQRSPSSAGHVKEIRFHLNDDDQDVIARDIILLEIMNKLDPESKSDAEFLWSVWYNAFMLEKDFTRLNALLEDVIDKYSNSSRDNERICKFGDKQSLKSLLETWNCWLKRKLNQSAIKRSRLKSLEGDDGKTISFSDAMIATYASIQIYTDRGIKDSDVETVGKEMLTAARDGFVNLSEDRRDLNVFVNPTLMRPGCEEWRVDDRAFAASCYLPLQKEFVEKHSSIHEACFAKMRETVSYYLESWKVVKVTYTFWPTDLFHLCHWLLPSNMKFDFIFTSNLMDHVGLMNLLLITQPRLKNSQSVLLTETFNWNWNQNYLTLEALLKKDLICSYMLMPSMIGLKMAEDLNLGVANLQGFYRTMYGRQSDNESIYWTKSLNQENVRIDLEESPEMKKALFLLFVSTLWNNVTATAASRSQQTPLALMYCFQRLQHLIGGGMRQLLEYVELTISDQSMDFTRNRITWDVVCWAFGQMHKRDQLCIVKIPFKDVNSSLATMKRQGKASCRLRLEYKTSSNKEEVLSLFQYDAVDQHFRVPILESEWKALPDNTTMTVINGDSENLPPLDQLRNRKVPFKREGIVVATYKQPKQIDAAPVDSFQPIICFEDDEKYRVQKTLVRTKASLSIWCELIVSDSNNSVADESTTVLKSPHKFSCAIDSYELNNVGDKFVQAVLYKRKTFNTGRTALPFRLIDDSELLPFTCGQDIRNYLEETMICDLMFCSPTDIESRATALSGPVLLTNDAFLALRIVIEQLWNLGSAKEKTLVQPHLMLVEIQDQRKTSTVMILDVKGYYMYGGLPLVKMRFMELDRNSADLKTSKETTTIYVKYRRCLALLKKMLFTNSLRLSQEGRGTSLNKTASSSPSMNTFLQMVFVNHSGEEMSSALHKYPLNTGLVNNYIEKMYSASMRQYVASIKESENLQKQMKELLSLFSGKAPRLPSGDHKSDSAMTESSSNLLLKKQVSCSECKRLTTDLKKCVECKSISYCSKKCQMKDWPKHKKTCSSSSLKANYCISKSKNHDEIEENGSDSAMTMNSNTSLAPKQQASCSECKELSTNLKKCLRCKSVSYCSKECQMKDWPKHKKNCSSASLKTDDGFANKESSESGCSKNINGLLMKSKVEDCATNESRIKDVSSTKKIENDHLTKAKIEDCSSVKANSKGSSIRKPKGKDNSETYSALKPKAEFCTSGSKNYDKIKENKSDSATTMNSSRLPRKKQASCSECKELVTRLKKCVQCKSVYYCSKECQMKAWPNHKTNCSSASLKAEYRVSKSKNDDGGASTKTDNRDNSFTVETNGDGSYLESAFECGSNTDQSSMQSKHQANHSAKKRNEVDSSLKAENPSRPHLQEIKSKDQYDAIADHSLGSGSGELCMCCGLEDSNMKKCTQCKTAAYCSRECQRADWKRHKTECQTQELPSTLPLMSRCNSCGALGTEMKKCSQCKNASYCSLECQRRDWKNHKITCRRP